MKKWIAIALGAILTVYLLIPVVLGALGIRTTQAMIYNGNNAEVVCSFNGKNIKLGPGEATVLKTSRLSNRVKMDLGSDHFEATFGPGQHFVNLGPARLRLFEQYYPWDEEAGEFITKARTPPNQLLYDRVFDQGAFVLDNCWDCTVLLKPNERPYRYFKAENKERRFILSSRM